MIRLGNFFFFQIVVESYALEVFFIIIVLFHIQNGVLQICYRTFLINGERKGHCVLRCFAPKGLKGQVLDSFKNTFITFFFPLPSTVFPYEADHFFASVLLI